MRNIIFCFMFLLTSACFSNGRWWERFFVIASYYDPPIATYRNVDSVWSEAKTAGINLLTGFQQIHIPTFINTDELIQKTSEYDFHLLLDAYWLYDAYGYGRSINSVNLYRTIDSLLSISGVGGINLMDEPRNTYHVDFCRTVIQYIREHHPEKLCLVNLLPSHSNPKGVTYDTLAKDTALMQAVCYDNYHQFTSINEKPEDSTYYIDLAHYRKLADKRPLWCVILTTEGRLCQKDTAWQKAYIRLGAFAPMAYGAKGLLYYTYDIYDPYQIRVDTNYHQQCGWDYSVYFPAIENYNHVFWGNFLNQASGHADCAIKNDDHGGSWYIKQLSPNNENKIWEKVLRDYGKDDYTHPFIGKWNNDSFDDIMAITADAECLIDTNLNGWDKRIKLNDITRINNITDINAALITKDDGNKALLLHTENGLTHIFYNYNDSSNTFHSHDSIEMSWPCQQLYVDETNNLYGIFDTIHIMKFDSANFTWSEFLEQNEEIGKYIWKESDWFYCNINGGGVYKSNNEGKLEVYEPYSSSDINCISKKNHQTNQYDMFGISAKDEYINPGLIDFESRPTIRHKYVSEINSYITKHIAPIVIESEWLGAYHAEISEEEREANVKEVDTQTPFIKKISKNLLCGIFQKEDSCVYLLVVNKSDTISPQCSICLKGNLISTLKISPRISASCDTSHNIEFDIATLTTNISWNDMQGGECIILKFSLNPHSLTHPRTSFDRDTKNDLHYRFDDQTWRIDVSANNYGIWDIIRNGYGNDSFSSVCPYDYNGDSLTDLAILVNNGIWMIDYSSDFQDGWDFSVKYTSETNPIPFAGDYDGDGIADICFRTDDEGTMYIDYSNDGFGEINKALSKYGESWCTIPTIGDYDGDGLDDLSLYRNDCFLLIDYSVDGLGSWNTYIPINVDTAGTFIPIPADYDNDGLTDFALYDENSKQWHVDLSFNQLQSWDYTIDCSAHQFSHTTTPMVMDVNNDRICEYVLLQTSSMNNQQNVAARYYDIVSGVWRSLSEESEDDSF